MGIVRSVGITGVVITRIRQNNQFWRGPEICLDREHSERHSEGHSKLADFITYSYVRKVQGICIVPTHVL